MKLIETKTLLSAASIIQFDSIPQSFTDLVVLFSFRGTSTANLANSLRLNGDTGSNYQQRRLYGTSLTSDNLSSTAINILGNVSASYTANTFGNGYICLPNYSGNNVKTLSADTVGENNAADNFLTLVAGFWNNTSPITQIRFFPTSPESFVAGSTVSLYGITKGSDGITTAS